MAGCVILLEIKLLSPLTKSLVLIKILPAFPRPEISAFNEALSVKNNDVAWIFMSPPLPTASSLTSLLIELLSRNTESLACTDTLPPSPRPSVLVSNCASLFKESDPVWILISPPFRTAPSTTAGKSPKITLLTPLSKNATESSL